MAPLNQVLVGGKTPIPHLIYGTAWKYERTEELVFTALESGFRAIDSALAFPNYQEPMVGKALRNWEEEMSHEKQNPEVSEEKDRRSGNAGRQKVFIQSKLTPPAGFEDGMMPYDLTDPPATQARKSLEASLTELSDHKSPLDAWLLHAPLSTIEETMEYWHSMESHVPTGTMYLGICNVSLTTLQNIYERATIKPAIVQNDFRPAHGFDINLLHFCKDHGITYQAYAVLKGNSTLLKSPIVCWLAHEKGITEPQALYSLVLSYWNGTVCILDGTKSTETMKQDLDIVDKLGNLDQYILEGFKEALIVDEGVVWPTDKST
ncbi:NADP-dependent oxidoreductase domain-containing protein [Nemania abortiva]|nr:NADP-dependent oxidoreductase domain-containing protein [Nemania abortiva]